MVHFSYNSAILRRRQTLLQRVQGNIHNRTCPKGPPFGFFSAFCDLKNTFFSKKNFKNNFFEKFFFPNFHNSCSLNIFEPKIWRRLGTFPSCCFFSVDNLTLSGPLFLQFVHLSYLFIFHLRPSRRAWVRFSH